jgi:thioredoxin 1
VTTLSDLESILDNNPRVVVSFGAPSWCVPCRRLAPHFSAVAQKSSATFVEVDVDESEDIRNKYQIQSVPTVLLFEKNSVKPVLGRTTVQLLREIES